VAGRLLTTLVALVPKSGLGLVGGWVRRQRNGGKNRQVFSASDRDVIGDYYRNRSTNLPPGLERQLERNRTLPPGLQKRIDPFPRDLHHLLPPLSPGYTRELGGSAVIVNRRTRAIADVIHNLLDSPGL
jgi:hypothetical protein